MGFERKQEIYAICVEFDVMSVSTKISTFCAHTLFSIVEDDPYYFLQQGPYVPKTDRVEERIEAAADSDAYIATLSPSFLKYAVHIFRAI
jgi:aromatic amino acid aminotransferase I / 2-aminoadipate transaminase